MNVEILIMLAVAVTLVILFAVRVRRGHGSASEAAIERRSQIPDPALPRIQEQAVNRLLDLPHFRRHSDGSLFDYYRCARLDTCSCGEFPFPHLTLAYGGKQTLAFVTESGLKQYVAVQERVGAMLQPHSLGPKGDSE